MMKSNNKPVSSTCIFLNYLITCPTISIQLHNVFFQTVTLNCIVTCLSIFDYNHIFTRYVFKNFDVYSYILPIFISFILFLFLMPCWNLFHSNFHLHINGFNQQGRKNVIKDASPTKHKAWCYLFIPWVEKCIYFCLNQDDEIIKLVEQTKFHFWTAF